MTKITLFFLLLVWLLSLIFPSNAAATIFFYDNFDDPILSASQWEPYYYNPPGQPMVNGDGTAAYWQYVNNACTLSVSNTSRDSQMSFLFPKNWNPNWNDYIFQVDFKITDGTDSNLILRFGNSLQWLGIHGINKQNEIYFEIVDLPTSSFNYKNNFTFQQNKIYRIRNEVFGNKAKISIVDLDTQLNVFSWEIQDQHITLIGKPGLSASTGAIKSVEVWFDNVIVCSLDDPCVLDEPKTTKTIFIPGLGASFSFKGMFLGDQNADDWGLTPGVNSYNNLFTAFEGDTNFYTFYYDWRKSILENAQKLNAFIESKISPGEKVNLIGHSLGGLVGRACIEKQNGCHADKLITAGSPFLGVLDVYPAAAAGEIWKKGPEKLAFELLTHYLQRPGETPKETLAREAPVIKELLPKFDYLIQNGSFLPWSSQEIKSNLVFAENASITGKIQTLVGNNQLTLKSFTVSPPNWLDNLLGYWPDGKAQSPGNFAPEGDGTVLTQSAKINLSNQDHEFTLNHGELVYNQTALNEIFTLLGKTLPAKTYPVSDNIENYLVFAAHSPVKLYSPQASAGSQLHDELIIIPNPQEKIYNLQLQGIDNGSWRLSVGQIYGNQTIWNDYVGQISLGSTENLIFDIRPNAPLENPLVNSKDMILQAVDDLKAGADEFLSYYLDKILALLNSQPSKTLFYARLFRDAVNFYQKSGKLSESIVADLFTKIDYLDSLLTAFVLSSSPNYSSDQALEKITLAEAAKAFAENQIDTKTGGLVYLLANQRLKQAKSSSDPNQQYLYSSQAQYLFLHAKLIK